MQTRDTTDVMSIFTESLTPQITSFPQCIAALSQGGLDLLVAATTFQGNLFLYDKQ